jgi:sulfotransferase family protein
LTARNEPSVAPPVFVVGSGRSGTTMLRLMLDAHPDLAIPPESHFIPRMWAIRHRFQRNGRLDASALTEALFPQFRFREWRIPADAVRARIARLEDPTFADVMEAVFLGYADEHGAVRWGDKTPGYVLEMELLAGLWPSARFVHLFRDGRDVALSFMQRGWARHLSEAAELWAYRSEYGRRAGARLSPERYLEVRYEALVERGEPELARICAFIDLDLRPEMLRYYERKGDVLSAKEQRHHEHEGKPPTKGLRDWRTEMSPLQVEVFEAIAGETLEAFGYERGAPNPGPRARLQAALGRTRTAGSRGGRRVRHKLMHLVRPGMLPPPRRW